MSDFLSTEIIAALTALVAVIVSPVISVYVVRRQITAQVVSTNRQAWINELRTKIARFVTEVASLSWHRLEDGSATPEIQKRLNNLVLLMSEIKLYINPKEKDHAHLVSLLSKSAQNAFAQLEGKPAPDENYVDEITKTAQGILKREWERVKRAK